MEFYNEFKDLITGDYIDANGKSIGGAYSTINDSAVLVDAAVFQSLLDEVSRVDRIELDHFKAGDRDYKIYQERLI